MFACLLFLLVCLLAHFVKYTRWPFTFACHQDTGRAHCHFQIPASLLSDRARQRDK